jgi:hypothetical protein
VAGVVAGARSAEPLEGLEQAFDLVGWDHRAAVRGRHEGVAIAGSGGDLEVSTGGVVADGVVDQGGDQALEQSRIARGWRWVERLANVEAEVLQLCVVGEDGLGREGGEVEGARGARARLGRV